MNRRHKTSSLTASPKDSPGDGVSQRAYRALQQHAEIFRVSGLHVADQHNGEITLEDGLQKLRLGYRVRRKLLSRIYHLQVKTEVAFSSLRKERRPYRLNLRVRGIVNVSRDFDVVGPGTEEGAKVGGQLITSGIVEELAEGVDLESLQISWSPETSVWEVTIEPYPGSYVYTVFPPMTYSVRLKDSEATAIRTFMALLPEMLES